ncbi:iron chelate uptake ABC transporter family permease subunit, partial [bacterium]|nr:iron chelate uptake ABC transporter family permease subunit [candidate division CSSED10-310 bacterium]
MTTLRGYLFRVGPFVLFLLLVMAICPAIGSVRIHLGDALRHVHSPEQSLDASILFGTRLPRILLAALTGAALAVAGAGFQALLRNPLATPYTLGVSSGGALGAVIAIKLGLDIHLLGLSATSIFA